MTGLLTSTGLIALVIAAQPALSQTAAPAEAPQDQAATTDDGTGLADIVVTAQRRSENLQRTALAVSAVDDSALRRAGVGQPQDLTKLIPALQLSALGGGGTQVTIRGVGNFAPFLYSEPAVAINYDGVYLARSAAPNGLFYDLDRVEVLKGPQGTLYGRNATGGAVNVITAKPKLTEIGGNANVDIGNYQLVRASAAVNLPLSSTVAARFAGQVVTRNGYLSDGYLDDQGQAVRGQLLFEPSSAFSILLAADYIHQGGKGAGSVFVTPSGFLDPDKPYTGGSSAASNGVLRGASLGISAGANPNLLPPLGTDGYTRLDAWGTSTTIDIDLGAARLTVIPAYRHTKNDFKHYAGGFPLISTEESEQTTLEARLASQNDGQFKWVLGGYYFRDVSELFAFANQGITRSTTIAPSLPVRSLAAFGQGTYSLTDSFRLTGGLRYTTEHKTQSGTNISGLPPVPAGFPGPATAFYAVACPSPGVVSTANGTCTAPFVGDVRFNKVTWKAGVEYDAGPQSLLYASAETGFKAGGFYPSLAPNTYRPENIFAVTLGSKNRFLSNRLQVNLEGFYWRYKDKQISHLGPIRPAGYTIITENAGKATIYGAEADVVWQATGNDRLSANAQYVHSNYDEFVYIVPILSANPAATAAVSCPAPITTTSTGTRFATVNCAGNALPSTPKFVGTFSYQHSFQVGDGDEIDALVGTKIQSSYFTGEEYLPGQLQQRSMVSYASLTYRVAGDAMTISAYIDNIEDEAVKSSSFVQPAIGLPLVVLRAPRTYGVRLGFRF